ncbi:hypothetical protein SKAU_G00387350 [Synaphobranchus kaupii]|uniref:CCHC-type domain-containing protein n=1 Tax=Synaphobranchus kaupii TaxID=118154 RepID=A0A9Q1EAR5_SYNKA|nr:hypothetical protein SKAU_G00387350 [Synaphobranchus kaupii]
MEKEVLGIQRNGREAFFDVAFRGPGPFGQFLERCKTEDLGPFQVESMEHRNHRVVIVNMFDMNLPDESVCQFLEHYARVVSGPRYHCDAYGFWNGHRVFDFLLRESDHGFEGFLHPPALCMVEGVKGHVMYSRQPPFCRRCMEVGHNNAECGSVVCHNCRKQGHMASECNEPRTCNICGYGEHLMWACLERRRTYADAAREGAGQQQWQRPAEEAASAGRKEGEEAPGGAQEAGAGPTPGVKERPVEWAEEVDLEFGDSEGLQPSEACNGPGNHENREERDVEEGDRLVAQLWKEVQVGRQDALGGSFCMEEVREATFSLKVGKTPGRDGITRELYTRFWGIMAEDVVEVFNRVWCGG